MKEEGKVLYGPLELSRQPVLFLSPEPAGTGLEEFAEQKIVTIGEEELKAYYPVVKSGGREKEFPGKTQPCDL